MYGTYFRFNPDPVFLTVGVLNCRKYPPDYWYMADVR
jgi:hypothetical protein